MSPNAYSAGGKFHPLQGNAKWSQVTSLANSNLEAGRGGSKGEREQESVQRERQKGNGGGYYSNRQDLKQGNCSDCLSTKLGSFASKIACFYLHGIARVAINFGPE